MKRNKTILSLLAVASLSGALLTTSTSAATFVSITDIATKLNIPASARDVRLKDTTDRRFITMYDMGMVTVINGCVEPNRYLTNGEIISMLASYADYTYGTNYTVGGRYNYVYPTNGNITSSDIDVILKDMKDNGEATTKYTNEEIEQIINNGSITAYTNTSGNS